jgi:hypothetical protein
MMRDLQYWLGLKSASLFWFVCNIVLVTSLNPSVGVGQYRWSMTKFIVHTDVLAKDLGSFGFTISVPKMLLR